MMKGSVAQNTRRDYKVTVYFGKSKKVFTVNASPMKISDAVDELVGPMVGVTGYSVE